ncbi:basal body-orientation factor 1-like [Eucyclogobius newberryi]|uniref:basal body-orientation factor 1-like n=1 Tax=Eucyclogobius newberryi TaxID=166745 RepID=UPI003B59D65F
MPKKKVIKAKKAKAGKGKKDGKQESKVDRETDLEKARSNAALWELRLQVTEQSLMQYRESCRTLARANEELTTDLYRVEKDSVDTTWFFNKQDASREEKIRSLQETLKNQTAQARDQEKQLISEYTQQLNEMKALFKQRSQDFNMIEEGMRRMKEFEIQKAQMEQEVADTRENMEKAEKKHREDLNQVEYEFFKEKARLEEEAERTIALVVQRAHSEAIVQLDDASRSVFRENVRLNEALKLHIKETEELQKQTRSLTKQNNALVLDKNTYEGIMKKNAAQISVQQEEISTLQSKVSSLEEVLKRKELQLKQEEEKQKQMSVSAEAGQVELDKLQKVLVMRDKELVHIKKLAAIIVEQRTELERFFHEALAEVKQEVMVSRSKYKKDALQAYRWTLKEADGGKIKFPPIRNFHKIPHSTNSVYSDMEAAAKWTHRPGSKVEISDLTWEQKEHVLRHLFAKMNGQAERKTSQHLALAAPPVKKKLRDSDAAGIKAPGPATFITQASESALPSNPSSLPHIHTA